VRGASRGIAIAAAGVAIAAAIAACSRAPKPVRTFDNRQQKLNEITTLWVQIRDWRREARMELDPSPATAIAWRGRTVPEAARVCPDAHRVPPACGDVCNLGDAICDNAERICGLADELGRDDQLAQEKCASAKASCREAKQRCCTCSGPELPSAAPAERPAAPVLPAPEGSP
jgi:hypothetical protein